MSPVPAQPKIYHITHVDNLAAIVTKGTLTTAGYRPPVEILRHWYY